VAGVAEVGSRRAAGAEAVAVIGPLVVWPPPHLFLLVVVLPLERGVPVVLDGVVGAAGEQPSDGGPLVAEPGVRAEDGVVLLGREGTVLHLRGQLVAPPQPARLARPPRDGAADQGPVARAVPGHQPLQRLVLLGAPRALDPVHVPARRHHRSLVFSWPGKIGDFGTGRRKRKRSI
jgi:hypothetical protein